MATSSTSDGCIPSGLKENLDEVSREILEECIGVLDGLKNENIIEEDEYERICEEYRKKLEEYIRKSSERPEIPYGYMHDESRPPEIRRISSPPKFRGRISSPPHPLKIILINIIKSIITDRERCRKVVEYIRRIR